MLRTRTRPLIFGLVVLGCLVAAVATVVVGSGRGGTTSALSADAPRVLPAARAAGRTTVVYLGPRRAPNAPGQVDLATLGAAAVPRTPSRSALQCNRVYYSPGGRGLCVAQSSGFAAGYEAKVFGPDLRVRHTLGIAGVPSRARVSADGRYGSVTMFVTGHSYSAAGTFSTQTTLIDMATGQKLGDLEQWTVERDGRQVSAVDVNYWGVTFSARDSDVFYATLATGGRTYLIRGSVQGRTARVIHENVECPSLSPDGTRIAYKKRTGSKDRPWRLTVLDLATMRETALAETRSVDDQAEWLDDGHVLYAEGDGVWSVPADGRGRPARFLAGASSPAVVAPDRRAS
jgi:hypothetical protein